MTVTCSTPHGSSVKEGELSAGIVLGLIIWLVSPTHRQVTVMMEKEIDAVTKVQTVLSAHVG